MLSARTRPSTTVTATEIGAPSAAARSRPPPVDPCSSSRSPSRAWSRGRTTGVPSCRTSATWATRALSRTSSSAARSKRWRSASRVTRVVGAAVAEVEGEVDAEMEGAVDAEMEGAVEAEMDAEMEAEMEAEIESVTISASCPEWLWSECHSCAR